MSLTRWHRDSVQIKKNRNEKGDITTETEEIKKKIIRSPYKSSTQLENLDEIGNFIDRYQMPKLNKDHINDLIILKK